MECTLKEKEGTIEKLRNEYDAIVNEKEVVTNNLNANLETLRSEYKQLIDEKESEIKNLSDKIEEQENRLNLQICERDENITKAQKEIETLKMELIEMQNCNVKQKEELDAVLSEKDQAGQVRQLV